MARHARRSDAATRSPRKRLIAAVHVAAAKAGLEEEDRRAVQERITGKSSCADMDVRELGQVLDEINKLTGFRPGGDRPVQRKIRALWISLHYLGIVRDPSDRALDHFVARQAGVARLKWVTPQHGPQIIEALKAMGAREGVDWSPLAAADKRFPDRSAVVWALWATLGDLGWAETQTLSAIVSYGAKLGNPGLLDKYDEDCWDRLIRALGRKVLKLSAEQEARS